MRSTVAICLIVAACSYLIDGTFVGKRLSPVSQKGMPFKDALQYCWNWNNGSELVTLGSEGDQAFIKNFFLRQYQNVFLGAFRVSNKWEWLDGSVFNLNGYQDNCSGDCCVLKISKERGVEACDACKYGGCPDSQVICQQKMGN